MSAPDVRARIESGLANAWDRVKPWLESRRGLLPQLPSADPRARVAGAFTTGLVLGKVVRRLGG